jgi:hypothetical protein
MEKSFSVPLSLTTQEDFAKGVLSRKFKNNSLSSSSLLPLSRVHSRDINKEKGAKNAVLL